MFSSSLLYLKYIVKLKKEKCKSAKGVHSHSNINKVSYSGSLKMHIHINVNLYRTLKGWMKICSENCSIHWKVVPFINFIWNLENYLQDFIWNNNLQIYFITEGKLIVLHIFNSSKETTSTQWLVFWSPKIKYIWRRHYQNTNKFFQEHGQNCCNMWRV